MTNTIVHIEEPEEEPPVLVSRDDLSAGSDHAQEVVIDAGIVAGISAIRADDSAADATVAQIAAESAANEAVTTAEFVHQENQDLAAIAETLKEVSNNLVAAQAMQLAPQTNILDEPENLDPSIDVEPENDHWLSKRWNMPFGKRSK